MPEFMENIPLSQYCTFGIGGPARYFIEVKSIPAMMETFKECLKRNIPHIIIGKGSNSLFSDRGFNGLVILNKIDFLENPSPGVFHVGAGYSFSLLGSQTARQGWSGLEFASGIPGSVGGAVFMNAGANGRETCESLTSVEYINDKCELKTILKSELHFSYRTSSFQKMKGAIVGATFELTELPEARQKQLSIINYRVKTQPYGAKSAGCVFRNPDCGYAGALIEQSGLKGSQVGDAQVSMVHANFIVNTGRATSQDVLQLIESVRQTVKAKTGIELESEVRLIPYDGAHHNE